MKRSLPHIAFALLTLAIGIGVGVYTGDSARVASYEKQAESLTINSNTMAVVFLDQYGKIVAISPMARKKLGWKDAVGRSAHSFMPGGGQAHQEAFRNTSMQGGEARIIQCEIETDGGLQPIVLLVQRYEVGDYIGYAAIFWYPEDFDASGLKRH